MDIGGVEEVLDEDDNVVIPAKSAEYFLAEGTLVEPPLGVDQKRGATTVDVDTGAQTVTINKPAVDMTTQEIEDRDQNNDINELSRAVVNLAFIQTELIDKLLEQGTVSAADFTAPVRQIYQDIKIIVDRAKPQ